MGAQVGAYSAYQLGIHNHLNDSMGGILNDYSRYGAYKTLYRTGAGLIHTSGGALKNTGLAVMTLIKSLRIDETRPGQILVNYDYFGTLGGINHVEAQLYVNGAPVGVLQHGAGPATIQENFDAGFVAGDFVQIWGRRITGGDLCNIDNFYIEYDWELAQFGDGTVNNLVTHLPLADLNELLHTEIT